MTMTTTLEPDATTPVGGCSGPRPAWSSLGAAGRARLLAEYSGIAVGGAHPSSIADGRSESPSDTDEDAGGDLLHRCDRILRGVADHADALPTGPVGSARVRTELVVDADFPFEFAVLHLAAALIADERVRLGLCGNVAAGTLRYVRTVAGLLPAGVLRVSRGDRLISGGTDRVVWLSSDCITDRSPLIRWLAVLTATAGSRCSRRRRRPSRSSTGPPTLAVGRARRHPEPAGADTARDRSFRPAHNGKADHADCSRPCIRAAPRRRASARRDGGGMTVPTGATPPPEDELVLRLDADQCWQRLHRSRTARVAFRTEDSIEVIPVNYVAEDRQLVFATSSTVILDAVHAGREIAMEADEHDGWTAWSVVAKGTAHLPDTRTVTAQRLRSMLPTAKLATVVLAPSSITGRLFDQAAR